MYKSIFSDQQEFSLGNWLILAEGHAKQVNEIIAILLLIQQMCEMLIKFLEEVKIKDMVFVCLFMFFKIITL